MREHNSYALPVFYSDLMVADSQSISPSAAKPKAVVRSWIERALHIELYEPEPVTPAQFALAHDPEYVRQILACERDNGFGNRSAAVAAALPYTTGAMLSGARHALKYRCAVAAPCSGFHHAEYDQEQGFCTFNGLMVTALALEAEGLAKRVGILDCDMHYGNGTVEITRRLRKFDLISHFTAGAHFQEIEDADRFISSIADIAWQFNDCDIVLYQAGADPHVNDPYGGFLTTAQMKERDRIVFSALRQMNKPVVWNLAGGYQVERDGSIPKVLEIHDNTAIECIKAFSY